MDFPPRPEKLAVVPVKITDSSVIELNCSVPIQYLSSLQLAKHTHTKKNRARPIFLQYWPHASPITCVLSGNPIQQTSAVKYSIITFGKENPRPKQLLRIDKNSLF